MLIFEFLKKYDEIFFNTMLPYLFCLLGSKVARYFVEFLNSLLKKLEHLFIKGGQQHRQ